MVIDARADEIRDSDTWAGIDVRAPHDVPDELKAEALIAVSIVTSPVTPILNELQDQGWRRAVPFYDVAESFRSDPSALQWLVCRPPAGRRSDRHRRDASMPGMMIFPGRTI
jgi:hypothetical protein